MNVEMWRHFKLRIKWNRSVEMWSWLFWDPAFQATSLTWMRYHSSIPRWTNEDKYPPVWPETGLSNLPELCSGGEAPPHPAGVEGGLSTGKHREERQEKQQNRLVVTNWILETYAILCNHEHTTEKWKDGDIKQWVPPCSIKPHWNSPFCF